MEVGGNYVKHEGDISVERVGIHYVGTHYE